MGNFVESVIIISAERNELTDSIINSLSHFGTAMTQLYSEGRRCRSRSFTAACSADSIIYMIDERSLLALFGESSPRQSARRLRAYEAIACEDAVTTAVSAGTGRLLVICDARRLSFGQRLRAINWARRFLHRVRYECAMNGLHDLSVHYATVDAARDVRGIADAVAAWHRDKGHTAHRDGRIESERKGRSLAARLARRRRRHIPDIRAA